MITFEDASELLGLAAARDQRTVGRADIHAWQTDLAAAGITRDDAETALAAFYQEMASRQPQDRFRATPVDLIDIARRARRQRLANFRYDGDPDETPHQYVARLRARTRAVADGRITPTDGLLALGPGANRDLGERLELVGRTVPNDDQQPTNVRRPVRVGPLTVPCPTCNALVGRHCRANGHPRTTAHSARRRAARDAHDLPREDPEQITARKDAAAAALAALTPEQRAQLDDFRHLLAAADEEAS